jgi:hypothetical protein
MYLFLSCATTLSISGVETNGACILIGDLVDGSMYNISHFHTKSSAPLRQRIVLESTSETTQNAILVGILALISHVITLTEGL